MAKKKNMKYTKEELEAMKIRALLAGVDPSTIKNEEIDVDEAFEEATASDKKKKSTRKKKEEPVKKENIIPMISHYENLKTGLSLDVTFNKHDIPYKEQLWPIPTVVRKYNIELVKVPMTAKNIAEKVSNGNTAEMDRAYKGLVRYFKVICYSTVPFRAKELAYIRVTVQEGKLKTKVFTMNKEIKENNINLEKITKDLNRKASEIIA